MGIEEDIKKFNKFADYIETSHPSLLNFSFENAVNMSDQTFAEVYLKLMTTFTATEGWWSEDNIPTCSNCGKEISSPKQLRMYHDSPYHPLCFKKTYDDSNESELMRRYWAKVLNLDF